jgi:ABC-2 type transport system permease protein
MNSASLTASQVGFTNKAFWRNPAQAFFIFAFPLMFLVIFTALLGNNTIHIGSHPVKLSTYYVSTMAAFGVITACFNNLAISVAFLRETGVLKRINGTPMPSISYLGARILHSLFVAVVLVAITTAFGKVAYSVTVPGGTALFEFLVMLVVGAASFCALGLALSAAIPNADAAAPIVNAVILPLLFLSGIFIPFRNETPSWILWVARIFPVRHFAVGLQAGFLGTPFNWVDVVVVAAWGTFGLLLAVRHFGWEPRS